MITFKTPINFMISSSSKHEGMELPPLSDETCELASADDFGYPGYINIHLDKYLQSLEPGEKELLIKMIKEN